MQAHPDAVVLKAPTCSTAATRPGSSGLGYSQKKGVIWMFRFAFPARAMCAASGSGMYRILYTRADDVMDGCCPWGHCLCIYTTSCPCLS
eukprot:1137119-Pelagomonas_calceolata.AAC.1